MAISWVVKPRKVGELEGAAGKTDLGNSADSIGRQVVVYADTMAEALAKGEVRLNISADKLSATLVG